MKLKTNQDINSCKRSDNVLSCFYRDNSLIYHWNYLDECGCSVYDTWGEVNVNSFIGNILIYPVPAEHSLQVLNNNGIRVDISIIDLNGGIALSGKLNAFELKNIDISDLPSGI